MLYDEPSEKKKYPLTREYFIRFVCWMKSLWSQE